jgi:adenylate cyclase
MSSNLFVSTSSTREGENNLAQATTVAAQVEGLLVAYVDKVRVVASLLFKKYSNPQERESALELSFREDRDLVSVEVYELKDGQPVLIEREINEDYLKSFGETRDYISNIRATRKIALQEVFEKGTIEIRNSSLPSKKGAETIYPPLITIAVPLVQDELGRFTHVAVSDIAISRLQEVFSDDSERTLYLIDKRGSIIAHPNEEWLTNVYSMKKVPIVEKALSDSTLRTRQMQYFDPQENFRALGAYAKTTLGVTVIAQVSEDVILEPARDVRRNTFFITGLVLSGSLFLIFLFSISITTPIEKLVLLAREVARGNFDAKIDVTSKDEVGELALAFDEMTLGLKERDKIKNVFNKFHGSSITEDLLKGDLSLGGSNKEVTVFFSDIRDFTKFSEGHTPEEVVGMLNEYFAIMVNIINKNGGVVDKFIGDAIMAVWGAPTSSGNDAMNAVKACIEMRIALNELNKRRAVRDETPIKIGIGIHSGRAISGTIGSSERMEYTVIGDTVNMTSRIESSTKAFGTDLLVSDVTAEQVKEKYILEYAGSAEVKGKSEPLKLFKVRGYVDEAGVPVQVQTPYSDYAASDADKVKIAS